MKKTRNINLDAFTIPKFHQNKSCVGSIKTADINYNEKGEICSGEILFVLKEQPNENSKACG
jgi:hypothetical protein